MDYKNLLERDNKRDLIGGLGVGGNRNRGQIIGEKIPGEKTRIQWGGGTF